MKFWRREATLQIGTKRYSLNDLDFSFKVSFEDTEKLTTLECTVKNLSPNSRKNIKKGDIIIINAGYEGDIGVIFAGEISAFQHSKSETDWNTKILAAVTVDRWLTAQVNKTYIAGYAKQILIDLLNIFGLEVGEFALAYNKYYSRGKVCRGKLKDVIKDIVVNDCKSKFTIKNQAIIITPTSGSENIVYTLTENSGLLASKTGKNELSTDESSSSNEEETIKRECLLNYRIGAGDRVRIVDRELNGTYRIVRGTHEGSRSGSYKTTIEVVAV